MGKKLSWLYALTLNLFILDFVLYLVRMIRGNPDVLTSANHTLFAIYYIFYLLVLFYLLFKGVHGKNLLPSVFVILYFSTFLLLVGAEITGMFSIGVANKISLIMEPLFDLFMITFSIFTLYQR